MTRMQATGCKSHSMVCIRVIDQWSMTRMQATRCKSHSVVCIRVIDQWSMTLMQAIGCKSHSVVRIRVIDHNDTNASTPFLICTRLGAVNDTNAGYWV